MSKYKELVIYSGNLMKYTNGQVEPHQKNVGLLYKQDTDAFSCLNDTLNSYIDLLRNDLSEEQKEKCRETINKHSYPYINSYIEGNIYVDENSIQILIDNSKHR